MFDYLSKSVEKPRVNSKKFVNVDFPGNVYSKKTDGLLMNDLQSLTKNAGCNLVQDCN